MYLVISNPLAGGGRSKRVLRQVERRLEIEQIPFDTCHTPDSKALPPPIWSRYEKVLLIGGDGTLHRLLNYWGIPPIPVGLISGGSGNDFNRCALGTKDWKQHLEMAINGKAMSVDLGTCNSIWFGTGVGMGFDGKIAHIMQSKTVFKGFILYLWAVIQQLFRYREQELSIEMAARQTTARSFMLTVGNTSDFGGGFRVTPKAQPFDGDLEVCLVEEVSLMKRILNLNRVTQGKHESLPFVQFMNGSALKVSSPSPLHCHMDGEHYYWDSFEIKIHPRAMEIMLPT